MTDLADAKYFRRFGSTVGSVTACLLCVVLVAGGRPVPARSGEQRKESEEKEGGDESPHSKAVAGKADVLRHVPKKFATLLNVDADKRIVELKVEGEQQPKSWSIQPDAELKVHGWWGRLEQFQGGDRVWVWFAIDRKKQRRSILMLADEMSQQDIHGLPHTISAFDASTKTITIASKASGERQWKLDGLDSSPLLEKEVFIQTAGNVARVVASREQFEKLRHQQQQWLRQRWSDDGLPGTVTFLHALSGEMEVMLDHEAIRWGRYLKNGDQVTLNTSNAIKAAVRHVHPWRERTLVRLVTASGVDQADLTLGERIYVHVPEPPAEIQQSDLPTDIGRRTSRDQRIDWFLASVYCPCKVAGNRCTGMFYTLASCNVNACGMPNNVRKLVGEMIDDGLTDEQIWKKLRERRGPDVIRQHLLH